MRHLSCNNKCALLLVIPMIVGSLSHRNENLYLNASQLIQKSGYPFEEHFVTTLDGYIVSQHRIPYGRNNNNNAIRPVALLVHGFSCASDMWILEGPGKSLAYLLADEGYDVWMLNLRGSSYSLGHTTLNHLINRRKYWDFSAHENAVYDLTGSIDYILNNTGRKKLFIVAHSLGGTAFFIMASVKAEYNAKVEAFFGLAPAVFLPHMKSPVFKVLISLEQLRILTLVQNVIGSFDLAPYTKLLTTLASVFCRDHSPFQELCALVYYSVSGIDTQQMNKTELPLFFGHYPRGASFKQLVHTMQLAVHADREDLAFAQFNYGPLLNRNKYNSTSPPAYNLKKATAPVYLYYGLNDALIRPEGIERLSWSLPNVRKTTQIAFPKWGHNDMYFAIELRKYVNDLVIEHMREHQNEN